MFKIIGLIAGYYFLGFFGGLLGLFIGSAIDRARAYGPGAINPLHTAQRRAVFLETLFLAMGRVAKADGRVSEAEIAHTEELMQKLGMTAEHRRQAIEWFKQGADPGTDLGEACARFMAACGGTRNLPQTLVVYLVVVAFADGELHAAEEAVMADVAQRLGIDAPAFRQLLDMVLNQGHFAGGPQSSATALEDAYKALGVTKESSDQDIKRAYRKLISQYHPDKLIGQGLPEDMIAMATEKAKEIQLAYDLILKQRGSA